MIESFRLADTVTREAFSPTNEAWSPSNGVAVGAPRSRDSSRAGRLASPLQAQVQRRSEPRYPPVFDRVWVQWWDGGDYFGRSARMVNISRHGAMLVATMVFPSCHPVRLFLEDLAPHEGIEANVISIVVGSKGLHQLHLVFQEECADALLEAVAKGFNPTP